jgi:hypothetical protein
MTGLTNSDQPDAKRPLSLQQLRGAIRRDLVALSESWVALREIYDSLFGEDLTILPAECKEASHALEEMYAIVQHCCNYLNEPSSLPAVSLAPRYRLLFTSQLVLEQTRRLIDLFHSYRVICTQRSPAAERTRRKIQEVYQLVLKHLADIPVQAHYLEEESKSLEQEWLSAL